MEQDWTRIEGMIIGRDIDPALVATALREQGVLAQLEWFPSSPQLLGVNVALADGHVALVKDKKVAPGPTSEELAEPSPPFSNARCASARRPPITSPRANPPFRTTGMKTTLMWRSPPPGSLRSGEPPLPRSHFSPHWKASTSSVSNLPRGVAPCSRSSPGEGRVELR